MKLVPKVTEPLSLFGPSESVAFSMMRVRGWGRVAIKGTGDEIPHLFASTTPR